MEWTSGAAALLAFLFTQAIASVIWLTRLGARVDAIERDRAHTLKANEFQHNRLDMRIDHMDRDGSRAVQVAIERLDTMARRLDKIEGRVFNGRQQ